MKPLDKIITSIERKQESAEHDAIRFEADGLACFYRQAKHTPKKIDQLIVLWKHLTPSFEIALYDQGDGIEQGITHSDEQAPFDVFVFQPQLLVKKDIFPEPSKGWNHGFRIVAPWTAQVASQAKRSKTWQYTHLIEFTNTDQLLGQVL